LESPAPMRRSKESRLATDAAHDGGAAEAARTARNAGDVEVGSVV